MHLVLARRSGGSHVRVVLLQEPPDDPGAEWQDVVEVSTVLLDGAEPAWTWAGEPGGELDGLVPGSYRLRVSAVGRDAGREGEFADEVVDRYLVELWPQPPAEDAVLRTGSEDARCWHRT